jgi:solute carrier family 45 protein 1/2/4
VWIAGPLCGIVIQPLMGVLSDRCRIPWGRRRPYILSGALATILSLLFLAWSGDTLKGLLISSNRDVDSDGIRTVAIILATIGIYALNISIQPLQMGLRALIVENCARHQQAQASAWASRLTGLGNIVGYLAGFTDLPSLFPSSSITQFQGLCLIASVSLAITVGMSCIAVSENDPESMLLAPGENLKFTSFLRQLLRTSRTMPWRIRRVCQVQFCAWMGWYPFLFYSTTYVTDLSFQIVRKLPDTG